MATGIVASFGHALRGLVEVTARERNMKLHVLAGTAVGLLGAEVALPFGARVALLFAVALVLAAELANSALEALVDLHTREHREEARRAKDAAAGGVLVLALGSVLLALAVAATHLPAFREAVVHRWSRLIVAAVDLELVAMLLFFPRRRWVDRGATIIGAVLVVALGITSRSAALSLVAGLLFVLAAASARYPRKDFNP